MALRQHDRSGDVARTRELPPHADTALDAEVARRQEVAPAPPEQDGAPALAPPRRRGLARLRAYLDAADLDAAAREADFHEGDDRW
jgi:hypothetical protein